ncbi:hypothetical protein SBY92_003544 [Candida maltosa Xu316]|uniref:Formate/nitrite transporter n=1 Tax=Candida maltosa (strain Xu316) TaxID=1245528 RepID=M3K4X4_CANMX|nr:hypothetical protein G210_4629 [Candida maltosa Xu316]
MSMDDNSYLTTYEAALAVVATAMKKARLRIDVLILNSIIGGLLFSTGGMLHILFRSEFPEVFETNPGVVYILQGLAYPIGLFYVVILGVDLFNSNILFFSTGLCRGAISIFDLLISWFVSWWFNLVGTIFVCYVICHYSGITQTESMVTGTVDITMLKASSSFIETFIKGIAGNFYVCMAIFLQLMAKPLHVKFLMMLLPIFTFVSFGFTHSVADMFMLIMGLINGAPVTVRVLAWKVFLPAALGNIVGGSFFGIVITWYLHIFVIERDREALNLPEYELRDEQPELNQDSRVVRKKKARFDEDVEKIGGGGGEDYDDKSEETQNPEDYDPIPIYDEQSIASRLISRSRTRSSVSTQSAQTRSPKNVFPVYGMGEPLEREKSIAGQLSRTKSNASADAEYLGAQLKRVLSNKAKVSDLESGNPRIITPRSSFTRRVSGSSDVSSARSNSQISPLAKEERDLGDGSLSQENLDRISE